MRVNTQKILQIENDRFDIVLIAMWRGISEVRIYGDMATEVEDQGSWSRDFYQGMIHGLVLDAHK